MKRAALTVSPAIIASRGKWQFRGDTRPEFAETPMLGQESVWDYPRPPAIQECPHLMEAILDGEIIASTRRGKRVLETAGAPTYYFHPGDVDAELSPENGQSICEWKGLAESLRIGKLSRAGWRYVQMFPAYEELSMWVSFYPARLACYVNGERAQAQAGGFYGGWVTSQLTGPIKGAPGSDNW